MKLQGNKQLILDSLVALAKAAGRPPSRRQFLAHSGLPESAVLNFFPSWTAALQAAGLPLYTRNLRRTDREFLEDWGRVTRTCRKAPARRVYRHLGKFDHRTFARRFGRWSQIPDAFRRFARRKRAWADVVALLPPAAKAAKGNPGCGRPNAARNTAPQESAFAAAQDGRRRGDGRRDGDARKLVPAAPGKIRYRRLRGRPTYGQPMDFRGLRHEPVNEQGVVLLFGMVAKELGYIVEAVQSGFPDCEAKRQIAPQRWQRVHLEFEFASRNFRDHGHPLTGCDVLVCWRHNWPDHPPHLEILELSTVLPFLPASKD